MWRVAAMGAVLVAVVLALRKELVAVSLDRETARAAGLPVLPLDLTLYVVVTATIVMSLEACPCRKLIRPGGSRCAGCRPWPLAPAPSRGCRSARHDDRPCCYDWPTWA
ncbi:metal ABC transporter permease [Streptomyces yanii]|uniref:Metal ABC transporter permease n=1 Tax=Streptomyces yanii TaxID=78510 RepID=A0ABV5R4B8_9ACTN